jgi:tetratricopeptide (TPR) repeat protein
MPQDARRQGWRDAILIIGITLALAVGLELAARALGFGAAPPPPKIPPKPQGHFRIAALGGSTVLGVPDGQLGFVHQLEQTLRPLARQPLDWLNLARSGAGSSFVAESLEHALAADADLVLVLMGHNEFLAARPTRGWRGALQRVRDRSSLVTGIGRWLDQENPPREPPFPDALEPVDPNGAEAKAVRRSFQRNLERIVARTQEAGVPLLLLTAPANLAEWPPAYRRVAWRPSRPDFERDVAALQLWIDSGDAAEALRALRNQPPAAPDDATIRYLEGRALVRVDRPQEARRAFTRARDRDPLPRRALSRFNQLVRSHAGAAHVHVVDVATHFERIATSGLVGFDLIADNCHPTPIGGAHIAAQVATTLGRANLVLRRGVAVPPAEAIHRRTQRALGNAADQRNVHVRWLLSNAIYTMKAPFFNYEASERYLVEARAFAPRDWRVHANLGTLALLRGDRATGESALRLAAKLRGGPLDPEDRGPTPYLKEALERAGITVPAAAGGS